MLPIVSVILPTYNREKTLPRAIDSVLKQTFQSWELLIWDDGSTDNTHEVVSGYSDSRIKYFFSENRGVTYARNRAIAVAHGKYQAFLDSDDEWLPEKMADQVEVLDAYPAVDILFSDFFNINLSTNEQYQVFPRYAQAMSHLDIDKIKDELSIIVKGLGKAIAFDNFVATDTVIVRREVFDKVGYFNEDLRNFEDFELWWRMDLAGVRFAYMKQPYLRRYKSYDTLSSSSILTYCHILKGLDCCWHEAMSLGRPDVASELALQYRNVWQNLILAYGKVGNKKKSA